MILSAFQDMVRGKLGVIDIDPADLDFIIEQGRRGLELRGNYYYMSGTKDFLTVANQDTHSIVGTNLGTNDLGLVDYKLHDEAYIKTVLGTQWLPIEIGTFASALDLYSTTAAKPKAIVIDNEDLIFYPTPDTIYQIKFFHWNWTSSPIDVSSTDELLKRWPLAFLASAVWFGKRWLTQNPNAATEWETTMDDQVELLKSFTNERLISPVNKMSTRAAAQILQASGK